MKTAVTRPILYDATDPAIQLAEKLLGAITVKPDEPDDLIQSEADKEKVFEGVRLGLMACAIYLRTGLDEGRPHVFGEIMQALVGNKVAVVNGGLIDGDEDQPAGVVCGAKLVPH